MKLILVITKEVDIDEDAVGDLMKIMDDAEDYFEGAEISRELILQSETVH